MTVSYFLYPSFGACFHTRFNYPWRDTKVKMYKIRLNRESWVMVNMTKQKWKAWSWLDRLTIFCIGAKLKWHRICVPGDPLIVVQHHLDTLDTPTSGQRCLRAVKTFKMRGSHYSCTGRLSMHCLLSKLGRRAISTCTAERLLDNQLVCSYNIPFVFWLNFRGRPS